MPSVTKTITSANIFSDALDVHQYGNYVNVSITGTFTANVVVQRSFDGGVTWLDRATYTTAKEDTLMEIEPSLYRIGVKTGGFTSGSVSVRLGV